MVILFVTYVVLASAGKSSKKGKLESKTAVATKQSVTTLKPVTVEKLLGTTRKSGVTLKSQSRKTSKPKSRVCFNIDCMIFSETCLENFLSFSNFKFDSIWTQIILTFIMLLFFYHCIEFCVHKIKFYPEKVIINLTELKFV